MHRILNGPQRSRAWKATLMPLALALSLSTSVAGANNLRGDEASIVRAMAAKVSSLPGDPECGLPPGARRAALNAASGAAGLEMLQPSSEPPDDYFKTCSFGIDPPGTNFTISEKWSTPDQTGRRVLTYQTPLVGDLYGTGDPVIVVPSDNNLAGGISGAPTNRAKDLHIFNGSDGAWLRTISTPYFGFSGHAPMVLADVDGDGQGEIILRVWYGESAAIQGRLIAYRNDGTQLWVSDQRFDATSRYLGLNVADFNGDGSPEVYIGNAIFNAQTGKRLAMGGASASAGCKDTNCQFGNTAAVDMDGDGVLELAAGNVVYKITITNPNGETGNSITVWQQADPTVAGVGDGFTAIADIDLDGDPDVVVVRTIGGPNAATRMYVWDGETNQVMGVVGGGDTIGVIGGSPMIGDIDGDGAPEIVFVSAGGGNLLRAYDYSSGSGLTVKWTLATNDASGQTSLTMFDFNNDGVQELVYRDQTLLRILDGSGSSALDRETFACASLTVTEMPVVADIDGTREARILVTCGSSSAPNPGAQGVLKAFQSGSFPWAATRPVWNQQSYFVTHVNNDLTIPADQYPNWTTFSDPGQACSTGTNRPLNAFQQQVTDMDTQTGCAVLCTIPADVTIAKTANPPDVLQPGGTITYTITVTNDGPGASPGTRVQDPFPAGIASAQWSCTSSGGAACPSASSGGTVVPPGNMLDQTIATFPPNSIVTYTIVATVDPVPPPQVVNTASGTSDVMRCLPDRSDPPCTSTVVVPRPTAELVITKTSAPNPAIAGAPLTYTIRVTNNGPNAVFDARVQDTPPAPLANFTWTCTQPAGSCSTSNGTGPIDTLVDLPAGGVATITLSGTLAPTEVNPISNTATVTPPPGVDVRCPASNPTCREATDGNDPEPRADLSITKTSSPNPYQSGASLTYTIVATNLGPSDAPGALVADAFPFAGFSWTCAASGPVGTSCGGASGSGDLNQIVNLPVGGTVTFAATGTVPTGTTGGLQNTATIAPPPGVTDPEADNNRATDLNPAIPPADLRVTKTDGSAFYRPGSDVTYTIVVSNFGPGPASGVRVVDFRPAGTTGGSWTCTAANGASCGPVTSGTGPNIGGFPNPTVRVQLPANSSVTFLYTITVPPDFTGELVNTAAIAGVSTAIDPDQSNNTATDRDTVAPADLTITKVSTPNPYVPGAPLTYTIVVSNLGPGNASGATVFDDLPPALTTINWTCAPNTSGASCGASNGTTSPINTVVSLPSGGSVTFLVTGTIAPSTTDVLSNTATVTAPAGVDDPVPGNNTATDNNDANVTADLRVTKAGTPNPFVPGETLTYTIIAANAGPSDIVGARVHDPLPAAFASFNWTCVLSTGAACPTPSGTGDIDELLDLPSGVSATFTSTGLVPSGYASTANNAVTITPPPGVYDPVPPNNTVTFENPPGVIADLVITKTQTPEPYTPGAAVTYTLLVQNFGPSDVTNARVHDVLPGVVTSAAWTCAASGAGASCASANGVNVVDALVTLPVGTTATFTIMGTVLPSATGIVSNTATVTEPIDATDPVPGNNTSTVNSGGAPQADLAVVKTVSVNPYVPGAPLSFTVVVSNVGPSDAPNARVQDLFPPELSGFSWTCAPSAGAAACGAASGTSVIDELVDLPVGGAVTFTVSGVVPPDMTGPVTNTATVAPPVGVNDSQPGNNLSAVTLGANALAELRLTKTSEPNPYVPGSPITYTIVASNAGPSTLLGGRVRDGAPAVLQNLTWTCAAVDGTCPAASGVGSIDALVDIAPGGTVTFTITADVPAGTRGSLTNAATIVPPPGTEDPAPSNNTGIDNNPSPPPALPVDLQITQEFPAVAPPNSLLTFRLRTRNLGPGNALNPYITGLIPPGTTFVSVNPGPGGIANTPGNPPAPDPVTGYPIPGAATEPLRVTWPGLMKPGDTHVVEFTVRVAPGTPTGQILWSCWWTWPEDVNTDVHHPNNVVDAYLFVHDGTTPVGDLQVQAAAAVVSSSADGSPVRYEQIGAQLAVRVGSDVPMRFWATNHGPAATRGQYALILDTPAIQIVDIKLPQGWVSPSGPSSGVWDTGVVQPGQTVALDLTVRLLTPGAVELFAQRITGSPGDPNASNERAAIVLDGYAPGFAGRWVAVGNVDGAGAGEIITGAGTGETPQVRVFTGTGADTGLRFFAYDRSFTGGVQIASCDVTGDGIAELITAPGPGRAPTIRVLSLLEGVVTELVAFDAFEPSFTGGASVACADLDADGSAEVVIGAGPGRAPEVQVYNVGLSSTTLRATFLAYEAGFLGGVRVAAGVYPGRAGWLDAFAIATTPGPGRAAELRLFTPMGAPVAQVVVSSATKGVLPTLGDVNGDGQLDLLLAPDDGRPELVRIFEVDSGTVLGDVEGGSPAFPVGIRIAVGVLDGGPGQPEIVIGNGPGGHPRVRVIYWPPAGPVQRLEIVSLEIP